MHTLGLYTKSPDLSEKKTNRKEDQTKENVEFCLKDLLHGSDFLTLLALCDLRIIEIGMMGLGVEE